MTYDRAAIPARSFFRLSRFRKTCVELVAAATTA